MTSQLQTIIPLGRRFGVESRTAEYTTPNYAFHLILAAWRGFEQVNAAFGGMRMAMADWRSRLAALVRFGKDLPEPMNLSFHARPPTRRGWPNHLPACPALVEFYALCDGGQFCFYDFLPLRRVKAEAAAFRGWPDRPGDQSAGVRHLLLGYDQDSFSLIWDSAKDELVQYKSDAQSDYPRGVPFAAFVEKLFVPELAPGELPDLWVATLRHLDGLAEPV